MLIPYLFRSLVFPFPSSLRRAFHLLHSTYIHSYVESMNLTKRLISMKSGSSLQVIILALLTMEHLQRLTLDFPCPTELYEYIRDSKKLKQLTWTKFASKTNMTVRPQCRLEAIKFSNMGRKCHVPAGLIIESASTLKSLSVHSSWYIPILPSHLLHGFQQERSRRATRLTEHPRIVSIYHHTPSPHSSSIRLLTFAQRPSKAKHSRCRPEWVCT